MANEIIASTDNKVECINQVNLTGSIVHKFRPRPGIIILTMAVKGTAGAHEVDYPNITFYGEKTADSIDETINIADKVYPFVNICGMIQTSRKETENGVKFYQNVVGSSIKFTETNMERISGVKGIGTRKNESRNEVCLLGYVTNVYPIQKDGAEPPIGAIVTIRTNTGKGSFFPRVTCFSNVNKALALQRGDVVCATAALETTKRQREGWIERFESAIATEIVKISDPVD